MIRFACIVWMLTLLPLTLGAQRLNQQDLFVKRGMLGIHGGAAFPVLDFADDNFKLASGYAQPGYNLRLSLCYDVAPRLGLALQYQYNMLPFNSGDFLNDLRSVNGSYPFVFHSYTSDPWVLQGMMAGIYYPLRTYRTTIDLKLLGGFLTGVLPRNTTNYTYIPDNTNVNLVQHGADATNIGLTAGVAIRHQLYKNLLLIGSVDFTYTEIEYTNLVQTNTNTRLSYSLPNYTQYYHIINGSVGLGFQFD
jgi:hypothetical protein